jgi:predicted transcriptional regulator of viral defense system
MSYYDDIYEYAADNYGLITSAEAKIANIPCGELVKLAHRGRLVRLGHGVYRVEHYIPTVLDKYAEAVAIVGGDAYIFGESVLAMHGFALVNPTAIYVATTKPIRKKLPKYIAGIIRKNGDQRTHYEGIPSQSVFDALLICRDSVMSDRLLDAVNESRRQGLITESEAKIVRKEIHGIRKSDECTKQQKKP